MNTEIARLVTIMPKYYIYPGITHHDREAVLKSMNLSNDVIIKAVSKYYNVSVERVMGRERYREFVTPRHVSMYFMRKYTKQSLKDVAAAFGRDHTTAMHSIQMVQDLIDTDVLKDDIEMIKELFFVSNE